MNQVADHIPNDTHESNPKMAANLRRPSKDNMVGRFKLDGRCKKHPKHVQSPGVCSLCLRDKLAQLAVAASTSQKTTSATADSSSCSSSSSLSSYYSSSAVSSCTSPLHFSTEGKTATGSSVSIFLFPKHGGLVKSRSMAVVPRKRKKESDESGVISGDRKKSTGFWFKLFHPKSKSKRMEDKPVRNGDRSS